MQKNINDLLELYTATKKQTGLAKIDTHKVSVPNLVANMYSPGASYQYILNFHDFNFDFVSPSVKEILGVDIQNFKLTDLVGRIHPDDMPYFLKMEELVLHFIYKVIPPLEIPFYKVSYQYRIKTKSGDYKLFLQQITTLSIDEKGQLHRVFGNHSNINHITKVNNQCLTLLGMEGRPDYYNIRSKTDFTKKQSKEKQYTEREIQILHLLSEGKTSKEIAEQLFISYDTVRTHRQNILLKSASKNMAQTISQAIRNGLI